MLIICEAKRKTKKETNILLKFFPKIMLKNRMAIGGKPPKPKPGGCPHCTAKAIQNIGLPRIKFNLEGLPRRPIAL